MQREIKFRVWDNYDKKWVNDWDHFAPLWGCNPTEPHRSFHLSRLDGGEGPHSYVVQQFTGLLDKKGKEIFEGDVVKSNLTAFGATEPFNLIVEYDQNSFEAFFPIKENEPAFPMIHNDALFDCEVVGNIFENPELLK